MAEIAIVAGDIEELKTGLNVVQLEIQKLQGINKIWQSNFRVINKTIVELRKKIRFVVPSMQVIPRNLFMGTLKPFALRPRRVMKAKAKAKTRG